MDSANGMTRRRFFQIAGGGIVVAVALGPQALHADDPKRIYPDDFNAYLVVREDGRITVFSGKIEMGQGVMTSLAQMAAEELGVELAAIDIVMGDTDTCPWDMGTFGSLSTRMFGPALRAAASRAREALLVLAARQLGVPQDQLVARHGVVSVRGAPDRQISYGELSKGNKLAWVVDRPALLRAVADFRIMGQSPSRLDGIEKVTGAAKYAADIKLPGMLHARILRPPMHGATLTKLDTMAAEAQAGVTLVRHADLVAVLHADQAAATRAVGMITAQWTQPAATLNPDNIFGHLVAQAAPLKSIAARGDVAAAQAGAAHRVAASYHKGYVAHAPIEPHAAIAEVKGGKATVWASTQTPFPLRDQIAQALGFSKSSVRVITPYLGGGFGGKSAGGQALEAARLAQITGKPVQVAWTRAEEFFNDTFDPACVVSISSATDQAGKISLWDAVVYSAGERAAIPCYDIPNTRVQSTKGTLFGPEAVQQSLHPFAVGPWRAPGANMNIFAIETQIDAMAAALKQDPLAFRLNNLTDPRMRKTLQAAADAFGWKPAAAPSNRGLGIACSIDAGTCVATIAEVRVDAASGHVQVIRMVSAQDMGVVVNPEGARMQIEGGLTMGLGYALSEELQFLGGEILDSNFGSYDIAHFSWVPHIETILVNNDELPPQGGGEPAITTVGAVIANAVFDATGARLLRLPMTPARVRQAIAQLKSA